MSCLYCSDVPAALDWSYGLDHILPDYKFCPMCGAPLESDTVQPVDIVGIVKEYLERFEYTALYKEECGCTLDDFMPCGGECIANCSPGYANQCSTCAKREDCQDNMSEDYDFFCRGMECWKPKKEMP